MKKKWIKRKLFLCSILLIVQVALFTGSATAQKRNLISISRQDVLLAEIVKDVEAQTEYTFLYSTGTASRIGKLTVEVKDVTIDSLMSIVLMNKPFSYKMDGKVVVLAPKVSQQQKGQEQKRMTITGIVKEADGNPLPGAAVVQKGSNRGVATEFDGSFELEIPEGSRTLVFSFMGKKPKEVRVSGSTILEVVLEDDEMFINQVVVTGIFNKSRESFTGSLTTITDKELKAAGNRSIIQTISNIDPSFNIADNLEFGSDPNKMPDITIRGRTSMDVNVRNLQEESSVQTASNLPLFIMDGFEVSLQRVMDMDEELVESITLLKDASATALYGSRGANGIVVITLKRPEEGKLRVSYRGSVNIEAPDFSSYNLMDSREKLQYEKAAGLYSSVYNSSNQDLQELYNQRLIEVERGVDTYWLKYPATTGIGNRHSVRIDGGDDSFKYAGTIAYNNILGVMKGSARNTFTGNLFFQYDHKNFKFQNDLTILTNDNSNSPYGSFSEYATANPIYTPYDNDGFLKKLLAEPPTGGNSPRLAGNPLYNANLPTRDDGSYLNVQNNFAMEWQINQDLMLRANLGVARQSSRTDRYLSRDHTSFENGEYDGENFNMRGSYTYSTGYLSSIEGTATLNYNKLLGEKHLLYAGLSANLGQESIETYSIGGRGFSALNMKNLGMAGAYALGKPYSSEQKSRRVGAILNVNYTFDRRFFADISGKLEGSSKFGSNDRTAPFWSGGFGWNMHNEQFISDMDFINSLRVRFSYGTTGSQNFNSYQALTTYRYFEQESYKFWNGAYMLGFGNPDLTWQKTNHSNLGFESAMFNGRLRFNVDFYNKHTTSLLTDINMPTAGGFPSYKANVGEVRNRGVELDANVFIIRNVDRRITWSVGGNMAHNQNEILKISNALEFLNSELRKEEGPNPSFLYQEGQSMNTIFVVRSLGIDPATGRELFLNKDGERVYTWDAQDKVPCGVNEPKVRGNLRTMFRWGNVIFNATLSYRLGGYIYNQSLIDKVENISYSGVNNPWGNLDRRALYERWQQPGDIAKFKDIGNFSSTYASSRFVMKENALNLNSVNINYEFNSDWVSKRLKLDYLSVGVYAEDLVYISTVKQERGIYYPFARKFSLSVSARF
jgi:TonB-linked SusC/RagA family outer membrane protein